jgi:glycosyltransferase involved in cell wall biosynthesis
MAKGNNLLTQDTTVLFVTFSKWIDGKRLPTNGSLDPLRDFLVPKINKLVIIDQLHPGSDGVMPVIEVFKNKKLTPKKFKSSWYIYLLEPLLKMFNKNSTQPVFKIRDFLSVIDWSFRDKTKFDYCICLESVNTIAAIILRRIGRVKKVVYYVSDYSPNRYPSKWFNALYLRLDRFSATHADYIWDVSPAMQKARISVGLDPKKSAPVIGVPNGLYPNQIKFFPIEKIKKHSLIYMGTVGAENGPDIAVKALAILKKKFKDADLHIIGGTKEDLVWLRELVKKINLEESVIFHGFVEDGVEMTNIIRSCAVGLAPYRNIPGSIRQYADAGKIRAYCASGIPVVSSRVPPLGLEVERKGAAIVTDDDPKKFASAIEKIFLDQKLYLRLRKNAILFGKNNTWDNTFKNAFSMMKENEEKS